MTFVGRIFVIVIMVFALLFLGISTVVFTTTKNWKTATEAEKKTSQKLQTDLKTSQALLDAAKKDLEAAKTAYDTQTKILNDQIKVLNDQIGSDREQITDARGKIATAQANAKTALTEAEDRRNETAKLRDQKSAIEKEANEYKLRQTELNDKIRELERILETTKNNRDDLLDRVARYSNLLRQNGLPDDITRIRAVSTPPKVAGEVLRVDPKSKRVEFTNGSDEGLVVGHQMHVYRTKPRVEYLGELEIIEVDPDQSVGRVLGKTVNGKQIREGDIVSSTFNP